MKPLIEIKSLSLSKKRQGREFKLLKNISIDLSIDKINLFLGKSGSGKTSILRCLSQIERKYEGSIVCQGKKLNELTQKERCQLIGFVPQSYALFPSMTVLDNCAHPLQAVLGLKKESAYQKVEGMSCTLGMQNLLHQYPHELSGGQQQRTSILRALLLNPLFLLLDEPTSALDPENTELLIQILLKLKNEGKGVIISSQDMHFAKKMCDRVFFLEHGEIVEHHEFSTASQSLSHESKLRKFLYTKESPLDPFPSFSLI